MLLYIHDPKFCSFIPFEIRRIRVLGVTLQETWVNMMDNLTSELAMRS